MIDYAYRQALQNRISLSMDKWLTVEQYEALTDDIERLAEVDAEPIR